MDTAASKSKKADAWRERIAAQRASRQSIRQWCRVNGCREYSFYWWRARLNQEPAGAAGRRREDAGAGAIPFAEVIVRAAAQPLCLRLIGGRELVVPASMPVEQVAKLIRLVEGLS
jgi:hypothetical protein